MSEPLRVGIVGLGNMGHGHAESVEEHGHEVAAGVDVVEEKRDGFADAFGAPTYESHEGMYAGEELDAVIVTTPNKFHEAPTVAGLERDVAVLSEKPLAHTLESAQRIADAARESAAFCMLGFQWPLREGPSVLKSYIDDGTLGEVTHVEASYVRRRGVPGRGGWFTSKELAGGGALIDIGPHAIDLALHFMDFPDVAAVSGVTRAEFGGREDYTYLNMWGEDSGSGDFDVDDSASALLRTADDSTVSLEVAWASNRPRTTEYVVRGTEGGAILDVGDDELTVYETDDRGEDHHRDIDIETGGEHGDKNRVFFDAVAAGERPPINTVEEGLAVQQVIDGIYRSAEQGGSVSID
ncbi:MAG: Gfo/Idh/MocA family protein [Halobacteriaceae archaeon]